VTPAANALAAFRFTAVEVSGIVADDGLSALSGNARLIG